MRRRLLLSITTFFSVLGIADSLYLAEHALAGTPLSCGIGSGALTGCNIVAQSAYSHIFGIPLGVYGLVFYLAIFVLSLMARNRQTSRVMRSLFLSGVAGMLLSFYFLWLQVFVIDAICIYCLASFVFAAAVFVSTLLLLRTRTVPLPPVM
jgi:uncharacterized membrane protein